MQDGVKSITRKVELLEEAIQRDPRFVLAYCALAKTQCEFGGSVHLGLAKKAAETAAQLRPDMGEPHRSLAFCYIYEDDYDRAHAEITTALRTLPNDATAFQIAGMIDERQNRWNDAVAKLQKAFDLDPKNEEVAFRLVEVYHLLRREREKEQLLKRRVPRNQSEHYWIQIGLAEVKLDIGDPAAAQALLDEIPLDFNPTVAFRFVRLKTLLFLRDYEAITRMMAVTQRTSPMGYTAGRRRRARWTDCWPNCAATSQKRRPSLPRCVKNSMSPPATAKRTRTTIPMRQRSTRGSAEKSWRSRRRGKRSP